MVKFSFIFLVIAFTFTKGVTVIDLALDFAEHPLTCNSNVGSQTLLDTANRRASGGFESQIMGYLVLEKGLKVAEYYNPAFNMTNTTTNPLYSINKSFTGLCFGIMENQGLISLNETLGDIWSPDLEMWNDVENATLRQDITIESLLTHTSGFDDPGFDKIDFSNFGGANLTDALNFPIYLGDDKVGTFTYLAFANILSYVVLERTGQPIQVYMQTNYMDKIGIQPQDYTWQTNEEGIGYSRNGVSLSVPQMSKWGQTYLQKGLVNKDTLIVAPDWVDRALTPHTQLPQDDLLYQALMTPNETIQYGYMVPLWFNGPELEYYCAYGALGQFLCVWPSLERVAACHTNSSGEIGRRFVGAVAAVSFNETSNENASPKASSSASYSGRLLPYTEFTSCAFGIFFMLW